MVAAPISPSKAAGATAIMIEIMIEITTVMGTAATTMDMDMARAKSSRARQTICTSTIVPPTLAAACSS